MIINTGQRTDIPAFYSTWLYNRLHAGFVQVRNPYFPQQVTRYHLDPEVVDLIAFCTKNPAPMLPRFHELEAYRTFWHVTITPYGKEIEPGVPDKDDVMASFRQLSALTGPDHLVWRYDPIFISEKYSLCFHKAAFSRMCEKLEGTSHEVIVSFLDLYEKTKKNFPEGHAVTREQRLEIGESFASIAAQHGFHISTCLEGNDLAVFGIDCTGCMTREKLEKAFSDTLDIPSGHTPPREGCTCLLGNDIGVYNTCAHGCRYCYANENAALVRRNMALHDPSSPFLIGNSLPGDIVHEAEQERWFTGQLFLE